MAAPARFDDNGGRCGDGATLMAPASGSAALGHSLGARKLRALRRLQRETAEGQRSVHVFVSDRLAPLSVAGYQRMVARGR